MNRIRAFLNTPVGKGITVFFALVAVVAAAYMLYSSLGKSDIEAATESRTFICSETGKTFQVDITESPRIPCKSPYSGKDTGYPAEPCYWNKDGTTKETPTWVFVKDYAGSKEPSFCPDCGRLVVGLNPPPRVGVKPPPTQAEYQARRN